MAKIFLAHSFHERDRILVGQVDAILRSHNHVATTGRILAGNQLTPEIAQLIEEADALLALLTVRENDPPNLTHPWVLLELGHARLRGKRAIGLYEKSVPVADFDKGNERIDYDPALPGAALVRLSEELGEWRRRAGRLLKIQIVPEEVSRNLGARADQVRCEVRYQLDDDTETDWKPAKVRREVAGSFVSIRVPENVQMIQLRTGGALSAESAYTPLWMPVRLEPPQ